MATIRETHADRTWTVELNDDEIIRLTALLGARVNSPIKTDPTSTTDLYILFSETLNSHGLVDKYMAMYKKIYKQFQNYKAGL